MESLHKNIQLMLEFLEAPFLLLYFPKYILMTFLMMSYVILLSMLITSGIRSVATTRIGF